MQSEEEHDIEEALQEDLDEASAEPQEVEDEAMEASEEDSLFLNSVEESKGLSEEVVDKILHLFPKNDRENECMVTPMVLAAIKGKALAYFLCGYGFKPFELAREVLNAHDSQLNWFVQFGIGCQPTPTIIGDPKDPKSASAPAIRASGPTQMRSILC